MRNEKQNDTNWISKLDEPGCLSAKEMIDKNAAWERLQERLRKKPGKNKTIWYWAAACLFIAFSFSIFVSRKNSQPLVKNILPQKKPDSPAVTYSSIAAEKSYSKNADDLAVEKKEMNPAISKHSYNIKPDKNVSVKQILPRAVIENVTVIEQQLAINRFPLIDTSAAVIADVTTTKKRIRVAHINELENTAEAIASSAAGKQSIFSITVAGNNQIARQTSIARDYAGIFKIKISSKN